MISYSVNLWHTILQSAPSPPAARIAIWNSIKTVIYTARPLAHRGQEKHLLPNHVTGRSDSRERRKNQDGIDKHALTLWLRKKQLPSNIAWKMALNQNYATVPTFLKHIYQTDTETTSHRIKNIPLPCIIKQRMRKHMALHHWTMTPRSWFHKSTIRKVLPCPVDQFNDCFNSPSVAINIDAWILADA